ncbi:NAD(P)-dependent oxidoreductase [Tunicatimonas pelagia]|uniref:NAD(P)-dependent oxidoreductase n=1 Tax=Tunicatimonas pelagia TaxID=931531 RepID=UPI0026661549|nr:SDR family oxidoreductase [Tunicatimonas pelagia]WKN40427.1 SDR family oxidoreductase [Tunicatimonas pelagia]
MKTIALFGGTGQTGKEFLQQALAKNYQIKALVRTPAKVTKISPDLEVITGDVLNLEDVHRTIAGTDIVVSLFGHGKGSPEWLQTTGTENILAAMEEYQVSRIISLSGGGLPYEKDRPKFPDKVIRFIMKVAVPRVLNDAIRHAEVLKNSDVTWTIVRGPQLTNEPKRGEYRIGWVGVNAGTKLGRADLADFILRLVEHKGYDNQMPFVSY